MLTESSESRVLLAGMWSGRWQLVKVTRQGNHGQNVGPANVRQAELRQSAKPAVLQQVVRHGLEQKFNKCLHNDREPRLAPDLFAGLSH